MPRRRPGPATLLTVPIVLFVALQLVGCATARMEVPAALGAQEPWAVAGSNPRVWNRPLAFGPWSTAEVREGTTRSWALEAFGIGGGATVRPYVLLLESAGGARREVACMNRAAELWRGSFAVDISEMTGTPRLACAVAGEDGGPVARLTLAERGGRVSGLLWIDNAPGQALAVDSSHQLAGSRIPSGEPVGYTLSRAGEAVAAVETVNRGRVWIADGVDAESREALAAAAAALLLFDPALSQR